MSNELKHVRVGVRRRGARSGDRGSPGHTLCGAPVTAYDWTPDDVRRMDRDGATPFGWRLCEQCATKARAA